MIQLNNYKTGKSVAHVLDKRQEKTGETLSGITMNLESRNDEMRFFGQHHWFVVEGGKGRGGGRGNLFKMAEKRGTRKCGFDGERNVVFFSFPNRQNRKKPRNEEVEQSGLFRCHDC
ncbi:hypothetical protein CDAR_378891 [Caerostris darwini]|uniref:Uncharacterized protein n=1 Tax=Caerostris darwini TaxID=1538125 RepID=A0AAV4TYW0_9ARAC|nr:hypothetical protein CDAR_378891 [Caerostris darwini]